MSLTLQVALIPLGNYGRVVRRVVRRALDLWPYALIAFLFLATSPYHRGLNNPNELVRVYMTKALVDDDTFAIDGVIHQWGMVDDKAIREGKLYSSKAPLQSLVGVPAFAIARPLLATLHLPFDERHVTHVLRVFGTAIFGILFAGIMLRWCRRRALELGAPRDAGTAIGLALALGTMIYPYAVTFTGHLIAAACAGGCYLAILELLRSPLGSPRWRNLALLAGFTAGATPFAEYPASLIALPALIAGFVATPGWRRRAQLFLLLAIGGAAPFCLGLFAHDQMWGSPFKTGYSFLENKGYVQVHHEGFFGITFPKWNALVGSLFSSDTGLFFFSPIMTVGMASLLLRTFRRRAVARDGGPIPLQLPRSMAIAGLAGFLLELYFISGHEGWRGGWTVGPRYIIAVVPMLGIWVVEALAVVRMRAWIAAFGALSIVVTGFAAALYPHLSDVYTNPLGSFLVPTYVRGEMTYGIGHLLGLTGHAANAVHIVPLLFAIAYVTMSGLAAEPGRSTLRRFLVVAGTFAVAAATIAGIPEVDPTKAHAENLRLWGFWEPKTPGLEVVKRIPKRRRWPGMIAHARSTWRDIDVVRLRTGQHCRREPNQCVYGEQPWQHLAADYLDFDGRREAIVFFHPIAKETVRAVIPVRNAKRAVLFYGLADASVQSPNTHPVKMHVHQGETTLADLEAGKELGLLDVELTLTSTRALEIDLFVEEDGARVLGFDVELYR